MANKRKFEDAYRESDREKRYESANSIQKKGERLR